MAGWENLRIFADEKQKTDDMVNPRCIISLLYILYAALFQPAYGQNRYALLVGISDYPVYAEEKMNWSHIHGENDVALMQPILVKQGFSVLTLTGADANHKSITKALGNLSKKVRPRDIVYIHLSGHGQPVEDIDGDEVDGWDEAFVPYDARKCYSKGVYEGESHLLDDELNKYIEEARRRVGEQGIVYVVVDACHAGASYRGDAESDSVFYRGTGDGFSASEKSYTPRIDKRGHFRVASETGMAPVFVIEACRSYEVNTEIKENGQYCGPLTYYISRQLLTIPLSTDTKWIEQVRKMMDRDIRLTRQNMVVESSK